MTFKLNKEIIFQLITEFNSTISSFPKSRDEILSTLILQIPEITCSSEEWYDFNQDIRDNIINRVKRTLTSFPPL